MEDLKQVIQQYEQGLITEKEFWAFVLQLASVNYEATTQQEEFETIHMVVNPRGSEPGEPVLIPAPKD